MFKTIFLLIAGGSVISSWALLCNLPCHWRPSLMTLNKKHHKLLCENIALIPSKPSSHPFVALHCKNSTCGCSQQLRTTLDGEPLDHIGRYFNKSNQNWTQIEIVSIHQNSEHSNLKTQIIAPKMWQHLKCNCNPLKVAPNLAFRLAAFPWYEAVAIKDDRLELSVVWSGSR